MSETEGVISLGAEIDALIETIEARASAAPDTSYTAKLVSAGPRAAAKKLGEEAVEAAIAAVAGDNANLAQEAADVIYHLLVVLKAAGVEPAAVAQTLAGRKGVSGIAEKAARK